MTNSTHMIAGLTAAAVYISATHPESPLLVAGAAALGSLIPDIDICTSKLGRKFFPAALLIQIFIGHRTLFHAPILYAAAWFILTAQFPVYSAYITMAAIGAASHIVLDCLNPAGIPLLYPLKKRFHFAAIHTRGLTELFLRLALLMMLMYLLINLF